MLRRDGHDFDGCQSEETIEPLSAYFALSAFHDAGQFHTSDGRHQTGGHSLHGFVEDGPVMLVEQDGDDRRRVDHHMPVSS